LVILFSSGRWRRCGRSDRGCPKGNVGITKTAVEKENGEKQAEDKKKENERKENTLLGYGGALREGLWRGGAFWRVEDGLVSSSC
jgi:hypothetical protein